MDKKECLIKKAKKYREAEEVCEKLADERFKEIMSKHFSDLDKHFKIRTSVRSDGMCSVSVRMRIIKEYRVWGSIESIHEDDSFMNYYESGKADLLSDNWEEDGRKTIKSCISIIKGRMVDDIKEANEVIDGYKQPGVKSEPEPPKLRLWEKFRRWLK